MNDDIRKRLEEAATQAAETFLAAFRQRDLRDRQAATISRVVVAAVTPLIEDLAAKLEVANHENTIKHNQICTLKGHLDANAGNYWAWQGDGEDHLESLTCPVVIRPEDLREILEKLEAAEKDAAMFLSIRVRAVTVDWDRTNARRVALIHKEIKGQLSTADEQELLELQALADFRIQLLVPLTDNPIDAARQAEEENDA